MGFGDFYRGDKKKKRKGEDQSRPSYAPVFVPPKVIIKGKKEV